MLLICLASTKLDLLNLFCLKIIIIIMTLLFQFIIVEFELCHSVLCLYAALFI